PALADAPVDDLLQVVAAPELADLFGAQARPRVALDEHSHELAHLVHVVPRLPLGRRALQDVARGRQPSQDARPASSRVDVVPDDPEVSTLQGAAVADEPVHGREVAMQHLSAVQLAEHLQDAGDLAPYGPLRPALARAMEIGPEVALPRVLERQAVQDAAVGARQR